MIVVTLLLEGLTVVTGPMFAGKTETVIKVISHLEQAKRRVIAFGPDIDTRYDKEYFVSHSRHKFPCTRIKIGNPLEILNQLELNPGKDAVAIDEVQFFDKSIVGLIRDLLRRDFKVVVGGLSRDFKGDPFGPMPELLALAHYTLPSYPVCKMVYETERGEEHCNKPATETQRLVDGEPAHEDDLVVVIGADERYEARCVEHHKVRRD